MSAEPVLPVVIAGAGPSGLILALVLLKSGIPVRIIDKAKQFHKAQRGVGIQPRTLELYNLLGVLPDVRATGIPVPPVCIYKPGGVEPMKTFGTTVEPTPTIPYPNMFFLGQNHAESILRSHLARYGCHVELGTELYGLEQFPDRVAVRVMKTAGGKETAETIACRWLAGADGAHSAVRKQLGLTFNGEQRSEQSVVGEIEVEGLSAQFLHKWGDSGTIMVMLRPTETPGLFAFMVTGDLDYAKLVADREELVRALRAGTQREDLVYGNVVTIGIFRANVRMVDRLSEGRVFLVGDAAHVHSPAGGQGMNSSMQDAINLGWKLALVERGLATPTLLASYGAERIPVLKEMLVLTTKLLEKRMGTAANGGGGETGPTNEEIFKQLTVNYRWSPLVLDERAGASTSDATPVDPYGFASGVVLRAGDRAPDACGLVERGQTAKGTLFQMFGAAHHTVLAFCADPEQVRSVSKVVSSFPRDVVRLLAIYPSRAGAGPPATVDDGAYFSLIDREGHAYAGYQISDDSPITVVIVRPDGVIGGIVLGSQGAEKYFRNIFSAIEAN